MIDINEDDGTAAVVAKIVEDLAKAERHELAADSPHDDAALLVIPEGKKVVDLRPYEDARLANPRRRTGTSTHTTLASFLEHVERSRDTQSAIFACDTETKPSFLAVYDYNERAAIVDYRPADVAPEVSKLERVERVGLPRFGQHRAVYSMPFSDEWIAWTRLAGPTVGWLGQLDFAQALEDRGLDVVAVSDIPSATKDACERLSITPAGPTQLMNLSRGLIVRADRKVGSAVNLNTGEAKITYEETHAASVNDAPVIVPTGFVLSIPVFRDGPAYAVIVRCRYKVEGAAVRWKLAIHRPDAIFRDAFYDASKEVRLKTGLPVFMGSPEA